MRPKGNVSAGQGGCWFCNNKDDDMVFDTEFDTYVHVDCIQDNLYNPDSEAQFMAYLLPPECPVVIKFREMQKEWLEADQKQADETWAEFERNPERLAFNDEPLGDIDGDGEGF